jgi:hypothetical protein
MDEALTLRAVIYEARGRWIAQCLEHDLCTSADSRDELTRKLVAQLRLQIMLDRRKGRQPLQGLQRAPQKFWDMYLKGTPQEALPIRGSWLGTLLRAWRGRSPVHAQIALAAV